MENEKKENTIKYSPTIDTIVSSPPSWTVKYGTYALGAFLFILLVLANLIGYNDVVEGRVLVTTENPIVALKSKNNGEIFKMLIKNGDSVKKGQILAVLKTTADYEDVAKAKKVLNAIEENAQMNVNDLKEYYPSTLRLGILQNDYLNFFLKHNELLVNDSLTPYQRKSENVEKQLLGQENLLESKKRQLSILYSQTRISKKNVERSKNLLEKGVISSKDHDDTVKEHLQLMGERELLEGEIYEKEILLEKIGNTVDESELRKLTFVTSNDQIYRQSFQSLKNAIGQWENENLIVSPIDGKANSHNIFERYQNVEEGDVIFSIVPYGSSSGIGIVEIPVDRFAKITENQEVIVKLSSFPYQQYGHLSGKVSGMSSIPDQEKQLYTVFVEIPSFNTSYGTTIKIDQQMVGRAQIVTEKLSLAQRIFYGARKVLDPNK